ncbi:pyridoxal phosphate-dependent decarboxylase family protein [Actinomadura mexicana]|uniref:Aromatic-L-amino-acid decarboxylase n=1 Tax=Actinomadura mexicana TaxID=134959 RepID=A0A239CS79_9ACTN|nr:pyridoxal-dependent decarboxylase [Actinomadura mexicana]SNS22354.1 aromatic-L-amino-acid decarboxylase [Actinomadura mexicana]
MYEGNQALEPDRSTIETMGRAITARIADYVDSLPGAPASRFGEAEHAVARMLQPPPEEAGRFELLLDAFQDAAAHGLDSSGPGYYGYFPAGGLISSAFADAFAQVYNRFTAVAQLAPALVAMEQGLLRWLADLFGLPASAGGLVTTGGSMATLAAIVAARHDRLGEDLTGGTLYVTEHTHFCVAKAARIAGLPASAVVTVPTRRLRMDPGAAARMIDDDRARGRRPFLLIGTAGTTSTGTVDPLLDLGELAAQEGLWFHADAAYGGGLQLTARGRRRLTGIERADSIVLDPHKSLFLQYGTGVVLVRDAARLHAAHADDGHYLQDLETVAALPDFGHLGPELTREFRGLRLWLPLHLHGVAAFRDALDEKLDLAEVIHRELAEDPRFDVPWEPDLSVVVFRTYGSDETNRRLLERINATQRLFLSSTSIEGRFFLRLNPTSHRTHLAEVQNALAVIRQCTRARPGRSAP